VNVGLAIMVVGFCLRAEGKPVSSALLGIGGTAAAIGAYIFAWIIWMTLDWRKRGPGSRGNLPQAGG
jgi:hypothetical protein